MENEPTTRRFEGAYQLLEALREAHWVSEAYLIEQQLDEWQRQIAEQALLMGEASVEMTDEQAFEFVFSAMITALVSEPRLLTLAADQLADIAEIAESGEVGEGDTVLDVSGIFGYNGGIRRVMELAHMSYAVEKELRLALSLPPGRAPEFVRF